MTFPLPKTLPYWEGIEVVFHESDKGRIYGTTFIDHEAGLVANGSRLSKAFSSSAFEELFHNPTVDRTVIPTNMGNSIASMQGVSPGSLPPPPERENRRRHIRLSGKRLPLFSKLSTYSLPDSRINHSRPMNSTNLWLPSKNASETVRGNSIN